MAQHSEEQAAGLLDSIRQHNFQAHFTYNSQADQEGHAESVLGKITVEGNRYRLIMKDQEIFNDGETVWTYLQDAKEVQISEYDPEVATMPWMILENYRQHYTLSCLDTHRANGKVYDVVALAAKNDEHRLTRVRLIIERTTKYIKCLEVNDNNGIVHTFVITDFVYDLTLDKTFFTFNIEAYPGVEIIDMR